MKKFVLFTGFIYKISNLLVINFWQLITEAAIIHSAAKCYIQVYTLYTYKFTSECHSQTTSSSERR